MPPAWRPAGSASLSRCWTRGPWGWPRGWASRVPWWLRRTAERGGRPRLRRGAAGPHQGLFLCSQPGAVAARRTDRGGGLAVGHHVVHQAHSGGRRRQDRSAGKGPLRSESSGPAWRRSWQPMSQPPGGQARMAVHHFGNQGRPKLAARLTDALTVRRRRSAPCRPCWPPTPGWGAGGDCGREQHSTGLMVDRRGDGAHAMSPWMVRARPSVSPARDPGASPRHHAAQRFLP